MDQINQICSEKNLQEAWIKAQYFAPNHSPYFDSSDYNHYARYLKENLLILRHEILSGVYRPTAFRQVIIHKNNGEKRKMYFATAKDNLVMMAILNVVGPLFEAQMYSGSFGNRLAYGEEVNKSPYKRWQDQYRKYIKRARAFLSLPTTAHYFITDIRNFYPSIDKSRLLDKLHPLAEDRTNNVIKKILFSKSIDPGGSIEKIDGVPTGTPIAHFLANIYLTEIDHTMSNLTSDYIRLGVTQLGRERARGGHESGEWHHGQCSVWNGNGRPG